jgi:hypothetical protein
VVLGFVTTLDWNAMEYLVLATIAVAIVGLLVFFRHRSPYAYESFDPTQSVENWDDHFPDTVILDTDQSNHIGASQRVRKLAVHRYLTNPSHGLRRS